QTGRRLRHQHHRVADTNHYLPVLDAYLNQDAPTLGQRLDTVDDGIFQQGLEQQAGNLQVIRQGINLPLYLQAVTETQLLDLQVVPAQGQLLRQRNQRRLGQAGAEQFGQVLHHPLCRLRVGSDQAGNTVHAVEQKVRPDARLQCLDPRLQFCLLLIAQLLLQIQIAQDDACEYGGGAEMTGQQPAVDLQPAPVSGAPFEDPQHPLPDDGEKQRHNQDADVTDHPCALRRPLPQVWTQAAEHRRADQGNPLHLKRDQCQHIPFEMLQAHRGKCQQQRQQLRHQHQQKDGLGCAEIRQKIIARRTRTCHVVILVIAQNSTPGGCAESDLTGNEYCVLGCGCVSDYAALIRPTEPKHTLRVGLWLANVDL